MCGECIMECGVLSVEFRIWRFDCGVHNVAFGVWSSGCIGQSVEFRV